MTSAAPALTSTGLLATERELDLIRHLGATRSRTVRAGVLMAARVPLGELVEAVGELAALGGAGRHATIALPASEIVALDRLAAAAAESRSRIMRAGTRLFAAINEDTRAELLDALPRDRRLRAFDGPSTAHACRLQR